MTKFVKLFIYCYDWSTKINLSRLIKDNILYNF